MADYGLRLQAAAGGLDLDLQPGALDKNRVVRGDEEAPGGNLNRHGAEFRRLQSEAD